MHYLAPPWRTLPGKFYRDLNRTVPMAVSTNVQTEAQEASMAKQLTITLEPEVYRQLEEQAGPGRGKAARIGDLARDLIQRGLGGAPGHVRQNPRRAKAGDSGIAGKGKTTAAEAPKPAASTAKRKDLDVRQDGETPREHEALVRRMQSLKEQGLTVEQIAHQMQLEGFRTKRGDTTWSQSTIRRYLNGPKSK